MFRVFANQVTFVFRHIIHNRNGLKLYCFIDPQAITAIEVTKVCTNDFTVSWTAASNEEGLSYTVTLSSPSMMNDAVVDAIVDTSYNFTDLIPNTAYAVTVVSRLASTCVGIANTTMVTTLTGTEGVPQSELNVAIMYLHLFILCGMNLEA